MKKYCLDLTVTSAEHLSDKHTLLKLTHHDPLPEMEPGQFVEVRCDGSASTFLRRPISINYLDRDRNEIVDPEEVYSGCYVQAVLTLYVYNTSGNKGIGVSLNAIRKIKDGERLAGTVVSESDWDDSLLGDVDELM